MFPYRDELRTLRPPLVTIALIATNLLVWVLVQGAGEPRPPDREFPEPLAR